jgi:Superinfection immunity protein/Bacterial SH3 domain
MEALGLLAFAVILALYFLPTIVAGVSSKRKTAAIFVLNLLLGWTLLGWVAALVWAVADERSDVPRYQEPVFVAPPQATSAPNLPAASARSSPDQPSWRPMPTAGQRVHLMATRIVRVAPEATSPSTGEFRAGTDVTVLRTSGGWVRAQADDGTEGWIQL